MSTFRPPSERQRRLLGKAQTECAKNLTLAAGSLTARGITEPWAEKWGLGVMTSPLPSLESCNKRLCIPYFDRKGVCALQFRCLWDHNHKERGCVKYLFPYKQSVTLFNLPALLSIERVIHLTEGALDAIVLTEALGVPVVGVPGADAWQSHWPTHFRGFDQIVLWADGDEAGGKMTDRWRREVGVEVVKLPEGHDVNSYYSEFGGEALKQLYEGETDVLRDD